ncbi:MAG: L,D-transpeptidase family protein [Syntrophobacteraceae bacterium]|nr:L,D-transpeptidase family protein [Syntrophobacteraceae bacterium]
METGIESAIATTIPNHRYFLQEKGQMRSIRTLPVIRSLSILAATAALVVTAFQGIGAGQTPGGVERANPIGSATSAARPPISTGQQPGNYALQTLWSNHIWQCIPASELKGLSPDAVSTAYVANNWQPIFINSRFELASKARTLLARLRLMDKDGIDPAPFEFDRLAEIIQKLDGCRSALRAVDPNFDAGRAQSFFEGRPPVESPGGAQYAAGPSLSQAKDIGTISKEYRRCFRAASEADVRLTTDYFLFIKQMDPYSPREEGLKALFGTAPISQYFTELEPKGFGYEALRAAYQRYRELAARSGQIYVSLPAKIRPGYCGKDIRRLQERLEQEGFYSGDATAIYDKATQRAVEQFQAAHMLRPDGAIGRKTLAWLNMAFKQKAALIAYSLQAVRNSPSRQFNRFIRVNIPQFMLDYYNNGQLEKSDKVVVGRAKGKKITRHGRIVGQNQTPTMVSQIDQIIFNPRWYVDGRIRLELNHAAKSNPEWFEEHGYVKMESKYGFGEHRLFQKSGPKNALGRVKFDFPNPYTVYLHDTPEKALFARSRRDFSHGCIRVDNALELAQAILDDDGNPYGQKIDWILKGTKPAYVKLTKPVPISVEYIPVVTRSNGQIVFAGDPYGVVSESSQIAQKW